MRMNIQAGLVIAIMTIVCFSPVGTAIRDDVLLASGSDLEITSNYTVSGSEVWDNILVKEGGILYITEGNGISCEGMEFGSGSSLEMKGGKLEVKGDGPNATLFGSMDDMKLMPGSSISVSGTDGKDQIGSSWGGNGLLDVSVNGSVTIRSSEIVIEGGDGYDLPASTSATSNTWSEDNVTGSTAKGGNATLRIHSNSTISFYGSYANVTGGFGGDAADGGDGTTSRGGKGGGYSHAGMVFGYVGSGGNATLEMVGDSIGLVGSNLTVKGGKGGNGGDGGDGGSAPSSSNGRGGGGGGYGGMDGGYNSNSPMTYVSGHVGSGGDAYLSLESSKAMTIDDTGIDVKAGNGGEAGNAGLGGAGTGAYGAGGGGGGYGGGGGGNGNGYQGGDGNVSGHVGSGGESVVLLGSKANISLESSDVRSSGGSGGDAGKGGRGAQSQGGGGGGAGYGGGGGSGGATYTPRRAGNGKVSGMVGGGGNSTLKIGCGNLTMNGSLMLVRAGEGCDAGDGGNGYITGGGGGGYGGGGGGGWESGQGGSGYVSEEVGTGGSNYVNLSGKGSFVMTNSTLMSGGGDGGDGGIGGKVYRNTYFYNGAGGGGYTGDGGIRNYHKSGTPGKGSVSGEVGDGGNSSLTFVFEGTVKVINSFVENTEGKGGYAPDSPGAGYSYTRGAGLGRVTSNGTEHHHYGGIPTVVDIRLSDEVIYRSGSVEFHVNSTDDKTDEKDLKCHMRYENPNGTWVEVKPSYDVAGGYWKSALTIPTDYFTGDYEVGVFFSDPEGNVGPEDYALFSVLNNIPAVSATNIPVKEIFRGGAVNIEVNLADVEDEPGSMSCRLQYRSPSGSWKSASDTGLINGNFTFDIVAEEDFETGYYDIRVEGEDKDGDATGWTNLHDAVLIKNSPPHLGNVSISSPILLRGDDLDVVVEISDAEDPTDELDVVLEARTGREDWMTVDVTSIQGDNITFTLESDVNWSVGHYDLRIKYTDAENDGDDKGSHIGSVTVFNNPPEVVESTIPDAIEDDPYSHRIHFEDIDSEEVVMRLMSAPSWLNANETNHTIFGTPLNSHVGENQVKVLFFDGYNATLYNFTLNVLNTNDHPVIDVHGTISVIEDEKFDFEMKAHDPDPTDDVLTWEMVSGSDFISLTQEGSLLGTPGNGDVGTHSVDIILRDGQGGTDEIYLSIEVVDVNDPPAVTSRSDFTVREDRLLEIPITVEDVDDPPETVELSIQNHIPFLELKSGTLTGTPRNEDVGLHVINMSVIDERGGFTWFEITLTVENVNDPPEIIPFGDLLTDEDEDIEFEIRAVDADPTEDPLSWYIVAGPDFLEIDYQSGMLSGRPTNKDVGLYEVNVSVMDGNEGYDHLEFALRVMNVNDPPVVTRDPYTIDIDEDESNVTLGAEDLFTDPDGDRISIYVLSTENISAERVDGRIAIIPPKDWSGTASVVIIGSDSVDATLINVKVNVIEVNDSPRDPRIISNAIELEEGKTLRLVADHYDPDIGDTPDLIWRSNISGEVGRGEILEVQLPAGTHRIDLVVSDSSGETAEASTVITVHPARDDIVEEKGVIPLVISVFIISMIISALLFLLFRRKRGKDPVDK